MKNFWYKRSKPEVDLSIRNGDYTGGYKFLPWMWHVRKVVVMGFCLNLFIGCRLTSIAFSQSEESTAAMIGAILFGVLIPVFMIGESIYSYKKLKKGISS